MGNTRQRFPFQTKGKGVRMIKEFCNFKKYEAMVGRSFSFFSPNTWTYIGFFFPIAGFVCIAMNHFWLGVSLFILGGILDEIDGKVARWSGRTTYFGGFADGVADRFADFFFIFSFYFLKFPDWIVPSHMLLFLLLFVTLMPPFIVAYANHRKAIPDPTEKVIWRLSFRIEYYLLFILIFIFSRINIYIAFYIMLFTLVLNTATVIQSIVLTFIKSKDYLQRPSDT